MKINKLKFENQYSKNRKKLLNYYIENGFESDEDLLDYISLFIGFEFPRSSYCSHHEPPAKILCDIFFERTRFAFIWMNRTGGKTLGVAILNHLDALFRGPLEICNAGASLEQAQKGYRYFLNTFKDPLLKPYVENSIQSKTVLTNGSEVNIISATYKGLNGPHPQKFRLDEVEVLDDWNLLQEGLSMVQSKNGIAGQNVLSSTRKYSSGIVQRLIDEKDKMRLSLHSSCIWEIVERCDRKCHDDPKYGNCPAYQFCGGKAHEGKGWYSIDDLIEKTLSLTKETFEAQWENKRPSDAPLVYGGYFDREMHVKSWDELYKIFKVDEFKKHRIPSDWEHVAGLDFGTNFAFLLLAIEPRTRTWLLFREYFSNHDRRLVEHARNIEAIDGYENLGPIFADPAAKQDRLELRALGVPTKKAIKNKGKDEESTILRGIDELKILLRRNPELDRPKFFIVEGEVINTIKEFEMYSWEVNDDGTPNTEKPQKAFDHCMDALRYAVFSYGRAGGSYDFAYIEGV